MKYEQPGWLLSKKESGFLIMNLLRPLSPHLSRFRKLFYCFIIFFILLFVCYYVNYFFPLLWVKIQPMLLYRQHAIYASQEDQHAELSLCLLVSKQATPDYSIPRRLNRSLSISRWEHVSAPIKMLCFVYRIKAICPSLTRSDQISRSFAQGWEAF